MTMAGGHVTTCDRNDYGCLPAGIRFLNMTDSNALRLLRREGATVDMVFADAAVSPDAISLEIILSFSPPVAELQPA